MKVTPVGGKVGKSAYLVAVELDTGTEVLRVNEVTRMTGPGLAADSEIEAERELTESELDAVLDCTSRLDVTKLTPLAKPPRFDVVKRY